MKHKHIIVILIIISTISCNKNESQKRDYITYDLSTEFPTLSIKDSLLLYSKAQKIMDSINAVENIIFKKRIHSEITKGVGIKHIVSFKVKDKDPIFIFSFDKDFKFLDYEKRE